MTLENLIQALPKPLRWGQCLLALVIFTYYALKPFHGPGGAIVLPAAMHFIGNVLLMLSVAVAFYPERPLWILFAGSLIFSIGMEGAQALTATRDANLFDVLTNALGIVTGLGIIKAIECRKENTT